MLTYFIRRRNRNVWVRPRIVIGVPSEIRRLKNAVKDSAVSREGQ